MFAGCYNAPFLSVALHIVTVAVAKRLHWERLTISSVILMACKNVRSEKVAFFYYHDSDIPTVGCDRRNSCSFSALLRADCLL